MKNLIFALLCTVTALIPTTANADWALTALTYNGYCPPATVKARLCYFGDDFVADAYITEPGVYDPKSIGAPYVVNTFETKPDQYGIERLWVGSEIIVPYTVTKWGRTVTRNYSYYLLDGLEILDEIVTDPNRTYLVVENQAGRQYVLKQEMSADGCEVRLGGDFTDPTHPVYNYIRDAVMTFTDTDCEVN